MWRKGKQGTHCVSSRRNHRPDQRYSAAASRLDQYQRENMADEATNLYDEGSYFHSLITTKYIPGVSAVVAGGVHVLRNVVGWAGFCLFLLHLPNYILGKVVTRVRKFDERT